MNFQLKLLMGFVWVEQLEDNKIANCFCPLAVDERTGKLVQYKTIILPYFFIVCFKTPSVTDGWVLHRAVEKRVQQRGEKVEIE